MVDKPRPFMAIRNLSPETTVIGLAGPISSGCSTIARYLSGLPGEQKFHLIRLSDVIRKETKQHTPKGLQDKGDALRAKKGLAILVEMAFRDLRKKPERMVIDGIRNPGEVKYLRRFSNFFLIGMDGIREERLRRYRKKMREGKPGSPEISDQDFFRIDERDSGKGQPPHGQNVTRCLDLADFQIINNESWDNDREIQDKLFGKADLLLSLISKPGSKGPSMQEMGMHLAYSASLESPCLKRQVGATIAREINNAKDELVIAVGFNRPPEGVKDCYSKFGDCYRDIQKGKISETLKKEIAGLGSKKAEEISSKFLASPETKRLDYCQAIHAEESAILQVAKLGGSSLKGTTLYSTTFPCLLCAKSIIQAGISKIIYNEAYPVEEAKQLLMGTLGPENLIRFEGVKSLAFFKLFQPNEMKG